MQGRIRRPPTLTEIASTIGVHVSTVSRVLRQPEPPDGWTPVALEIRKLAQELGYQPNLMAASLRTRRSMTLGVVISRLPDPVMSSMYDSLNEAALAAGYQVLLSTSGDTIEAQRRSANVLLSRQIDGLILASTHYQCHDFMEEINSKGVPVLLVNRHGGYLDRLNVTCDDRNGGYLAVKHLIELGHRRIGVVGGPMHASTARDRVEGARDAMCEAAIDFPEELIVHSDFDVEGGLSAGEILLNMPNRPTAIFAVSDPAAIAVMNIAKNLGLEVPKDLSIVGFNDLPITHLLPIPLTTIQSPYNEMGRLALLQMLDVIGKKEVGNIKLPVKLVSRQSCAFLK